MPFESHLGGRAKPLTFSADAKYEAVLRVLRGEDSMRVAAELNISINRLEKWERRFLDGARQTMTDHKKGSSGIPAIFHTSHNTQKKRIGWGTLLIVMVVVIYFFVRFMGSGGSPE